MFEKFKELWDDISVFEEKEVKSWKNVEPLRQDARAAARMEAYVKLSDNFLKVK